MLYTNQVKSAAKNADTLTYHKVMKTVYYESLLTAVDISSEIILKECKDTLAEPNKLWMLIKNDLSDWMLVNNARNCIIHDFGVMRWKGFYDIFGYCTIMKSLI